MQYTNVPSYDYPDHPIENEPKLPDPDPYPKDPVVDPSPPPPPPRQPTRPPIGNPGPGTSVAQPFAGYVELPEIIFHVSPKYPVLARNAGIEGTVVVLVVVEVDGSISDVSVHSSDGTASMESAALKAALRCRFNPASQNGRPVKASVTLPFEFRLR